MNESQRLIWRGSERDFFSLETGWQRGGRTHGVGSLPSKGCQLQSSPRASGKSLILRWGRFCTMK